MSTYEDHDREESVRREVAASPSPDTSPVPCLLCGAEPYELAAIDMVHCSTESCPLAKSNTERVDWNALQSALHAHAEARVDEAFVGSDWVSMPNHEERTASAVAEAVAAVDLPAIGSVWKTESLTGPPATAEVRNVLICVEYDGDADRRYSMEEWRTHFTPAPSGAAREGE